jgi:zinc finger protein 830
MATDVRALLKQKRQEARIAHPLATYTAAGVLRCAACNAAVAHGAGAWEGHLGSKAHRLAAARLREADARAAEDARVARKRKAAEEAADADTAPDTKRQAVPTPAGFPADFFSDPSRAASIPEPDSDDEETQPGPPTGLDAEFAAFQAALAAPAEDAKEAYERATVFGAAELVSAPEGIPASALGLPDAAPEPEPELTDEQLRQLRAHDEAELVMDRLLEEERAQEDADAKVAALRARMDALRRTREAARRAKAG